MTDTTDIKALRDAATKYAKSLEAHIRTPLDHDLVRAMDSACWELTDLIGNNELSVVINLLDKLEAERQRADDEAALNKHLDLAIRQNEGINNNLRRRAVRAEAEIAALKGDQVPVALVDERQGCGGFCLTQHGRRLNIPHGTELFTAPQKPVLHPQLLSDIRQCVIDATAWCTHRTPPDYVSNVNAWLDDGGVVKDGE